MADDATALAYAAFDIASQPRLAARPISRDLYDEDGKTIRYEHCGRSWSGTVGIASVVMNDGNGEVQFCGIGELRALRDAAQKALEMAECA